MDKVNLDELLNYKEEYSKFVQKPEYKKERIHDANFSSGKNKGVVHVDRKHQRNTTVTRSRLPRCYQKTSENPLFLQKSNTSNTKKTKYIRDEAERQTASAFRIYQL